MLLKSACLVLALALFSQECSAFCSCGFGPGEDMCKNSPAACQPLVVRPYDLPKPKPLAPPAPPALPVPPVAPIVNPLKPMAGPCQCKQPIVKPAVVPKPVCATCGCAGVRTTALNQQSASTLVNHEYMMGGASCGAASAPLPYPLPTAPLNPAQLAPADPVSLALAYKLAQKQCHTASEDKLAFGFRTLPKECPAVVKIKNCIPEENLFGINGQIVELKPVACGSQKSVDEEAAEDLLALSEEDLDVGTVIRKPSLGEIGYGPAKIVPASFVSVAAGAAANAAAAMTSQKCQAGFQPGSVTYNQIPKMEQFVLPPPPLEPCDDEIQCVPSSYSPYSLTSKYTHQSSAASSQAAHSSVLFHKLGCL